MTIHRRRMPPTRYPRNLEEAYRKRIVRLVYSWRRTAMEYFDRYMRKYFTGGTRLIGDAQAPPTTTQTQEMIENLHLLGYTIKQAVSDATIRMMAQQFVRSIDTFSYNNVALQIKIAGLNPIRNDPNLTRIFNAKVAENVELIKYMRDRYADSITGVVSRAISNGDGTNGLGLCLC